MRARGLLGNGRNGPGPQGAPARPQPIGAERAPVRFRYARWLMKRWLGLLVVAGLLQSGPLLAQTRVADSLRAVLEASPRPDTTRVRRLQALSAELMMVDLPRSVAALQQALALSRQVHDPVGEGRALIRLGTLSRLQANYPAARRYTRQALAFFSRRADLRGLSTAYLQLSLIENGQGNPADALRAALQGVPFAEQAGDRVNLTRLQMMLGSVYVQLGNFDEALPMLRTTLKNAEELSDKPVVAAVLSLLGNAHQAERKWPEALAYYRRAMRQNRQLGDERSLTIDQISLAELYAAQGNFGQSLNFARRARAQAKASHDSFNLPSAELAMARAYLATQRPDSALALARHGYALARVQRKKENLRDATELLAQAYAQGGQYAEAYRFQRLWVAYKDSLSGEKTQSKTSALRYGFELDKKQTQIALLTKTRQLQAQKAARQHQEVYGLLLGLLGTALLAVLLGRNIYLKQRANLTLNIKNEHIAQQRDDLNCALLELKATQTQLVQSEKMVALAALTAGVAHEIQNPLNFVNNFSEVSMELVAELEEEERKPTRDLALEIGLLGDLKQNLRKIHQHGSRAGDIVKGMLEHSLADTGQRQPVDLNALVRDYLRLAYHDHQDKHLDFVVRRTLDLNPNLGPLHMVPQEIGRVLLNLFANAFYAVQRKADLLGPAYTPELQVCTRRLGTHIELRVRDNGTGIAPAIAGKIFEPFFTTKPPGEGIGLGLWFSYDIITKGYGGKLTVRTKEGEYTEFVVTLPQQAPYPLPLHDGADGAPEAA